MHPGYKVVGFGVTRQHQLPRRGNIHRRKAHLVPSLELAEQRVEVRQPINAVYYRNTALASRITCFLDFLSERLGCPS